MTHIENIEIVWKDINDFDPKILTNMFYGVYNYTDCCLIKRANGLIEYAEISTTETFRKEMRDDDWLTTNLASNLPVDINGVINYEEIQSYLDKHEIVIYQKTYFTEYGDFAGTETTIYDDVIEIALVPKSDTLYALINADI